MAQLLGVLKQRFFDANGAPLVGGKLYSYEAGTSTPLATYTDQTGAVQNANPVILDANGEADVWLGNSAYKFVLSDADDNILETTDRVSLIGDGSIINVKLADGSVTTSKIVDLNVTTAKINDQAVTTAKLADSSVTTVKIQDSNVTTTKIADLNVTTEKIADGAITQSKRVSLGQQISGGSGLFSISSTSYVDVTNLSVTITTTGRLVFLGLIPTDTAPLSYLGISRNSSDAQGYISIVRGATKLTEQVLLAQMSGTTTVKSFIPVGSVWFVDSVSAGTYTYKIQAKVNTGTSSEEITIQFAKLVAYEL